MGRDTRRGGEGWRQHDTPLLGRCGHTSNAPPARLFEDLARAQRRIDQQLGGWRQRREEVD
eukprot:scaffold114700_cov48-Phaeocystis_antarctica.AAC.1